MSGRRSGSFWTSSCECCPVIALCCAQALGSSRGGGLDPVQGAELLLQGVWADAAPWQLGTSWSLDAQCLGGSQVTLRPRALPANPVPPLHLPRPCFPGWRSCAGWVGAVEEGVTPWPHSRWCGEHSPRLSPGVAFAFPCTGLQGLLLGCRRSRKAESSGQGISTEE